MPEHIKRLAVHIALLRLGCCKGGEMVIGMQVLHLLLELLFFASAVQGQRNNSASPSTGAIAGFAVVLSFLVISLCLVILLCFCFGKCRIPCKKEPRIGTIRSAFNSQRQSTASRRNLASQQLPKSRVRPFSLDSATTTSVHPDRQQRFASLPPSESYTTSMPPALRSSDPQQLFEAVNFLPASSSSSNKVVNLSELNAESFKKLTTGSSTGSQQPRGALLKTQNTPSQQRRGSDQGKLTASGAAVSMKRPADVLESGLPYQPQKSPFITRGHTTNRPIYSLMPMSTRPGPASNPPGLIPYLGRNSTKNESPIPDTGDDMSNSIISEHGNFSFPPQHQQDGSTDHNSSKVSQAKTPLPHSTVV